MISEGRLLLMKAERSVPDDRLQSLVRELTSLFGERFTTSAADRDHHGHGESYHPTYPPDAVCYAASTEEVAAIVRLCQRYHVPVVPYGAGTSLEGHVAALQGGVCIDVSRMREILAVHPEDLD